MHSVVYTQERLLNTYLGRQTPKLEQWYHNEKNEDKSSQIFRGLLGFARGGGRRLYKGSMTCLIHENCSQDVQRGKEEAGKKDGVYLGRARLETSSVNGRCRVESASRMVRQKRMNDKIVNCSLEKKNVNSSAGKAKTCPSHFRLRLHRFLPTI